MRDARSEYRLGAVTLGVITALSLSAIFLPQILAQATVRYEVRSTLADDITGLGPGSKVRMAGMPCGEVIELRDEVRSDGHVDVLIEIEIALSPAIYPGAKLRVTRDPISQMAAVDIYDVGTPGGSETPLQAGSVLVLAQHGPDMSGIMNPSLAGSLSTIGERFEQARTAFSGLESPTPRFHTLRDAASELRDWLATDLPSDRERINELADRFRGIRDAIRDRIDEARTLVDGFQPIKASFSLSASEGGSWAIASEEMHAAMEAWQATAPTRAAITATLDRWRAHGEAVRAAGERVRDRFREVGEVLAMRDVAANLSLTGTGVSKLYAEIFADPLKALIPYESERDRKLDAVETVMRTLLFSLDEAEVAEANLRALARAGSSLEAGASDALRQLEDALKHLASLEEAIRTLRDAAEAPGPKP